MDTKNNRKLRVGVLGCGPIAQFAHFEACKKGRNIELHSICDKATDLLERMHYLWKPKYKFTDYDKMLNDPNLDAVIIPFEFIIERLNNYGVSCPIVAHGFEEKYAKSVVEYSSSLLEN